MRGEMAGMLIVKIGGAEGIGYEPLVEDIVALAHAGRRMVLVHGGSAETSELQERLGSSPQMVVAPSGHESRFTDDEALDAFIMACAGRVNTDLVARLRRGGADAVGLSGLDGGLCSGPVKDAIKVERDGRRFLMRGNRSGRVERVRPEVLSALMGAGFLPVVGPPVLSDSGYPMNTDADRMAAAIALSLGAEDLVLLTNVPGILRDPDGDPTLIRRVDGREDFARARGSARGRMAAKLLAAEEALRGGVRRAIIADARAAKPVTDALAGLGTVLSDESGELEGLR